MRVIVTGPLHFFLLKPRQGAYLKPLVQQRKQERKSEAWFMLLRKVLYVGYGQPSL